MGGVDLGRHVAGMVGIAEHVATREVVAQPRGAILQRLLGRRGVAGGDARDQPRRVIAHVR